jgi:hypothetical protein
MIDVLTEDVIELDDAKKYLPGRPDRSTIWRWALSEEGVNGAVLESFKCGRKRYTSKQACQRFVEAQNQSIDAAPAPNSRKRKAAADDPAARARLAKAGLL